MRAPVEVVVTALGSTALPIAARLTPLLVMYALMIVGLFLPALSLTQEKEQGTLLALSVTPARLGEVVAAKGIAGFVLGAVMSLVTLALNGVLLQAGALPLAVVVAAGVGPVRAARAHLRHGLQGPDRPVCRDQGHRLPAGGADRVLHLPALAAVDRQADPHLLGHQPDLRTLNGAGLLDVWGELVVAAGIIALLWVPIAALTRRLGTQLAAG